jgi:hypothetical protein
LPTTPYDEEGKSIARAWEWYMVHDHVWKSAGMPVGIGPEDTGFLCLGCLEIRLGRRLTACDFTEWPVNSSCASNTLRMEDRVAGLETLEIGEAADLVEWQAETMVREAGL